AEPEAEPKPEAEAKAEPEAEPKPEAEAKAEPEAEPKPEAEAKAEPEARAEPQPEPVAEARPEPEPVSEPEPAAAEAHEPQAADGEDTPQGPLAADNESRTGGAGGNKTAEGEAEARPEPEPAAQAELTAEAEPTAKTETKKAPKPTAEPKVKGKAGTKTTAKPTAEPKTTAKPTAEPKTAPEPTAEPPAQPADPATPLTQVKSRTPSLTTAYKAATTTLKKTNLTGTRAKLYLVLDRSASMRPYYKDGSAQALADQTLALAAHLDPEAAVHVVFFSTEVDGTTDLTLTADHETKIDDVHASLGRMGRTSYHAAVEAVLAHYEKNADPTTPALVIFQTDGAPDAKTPATQSLTEAAKNHPSVFFSFVAFGDQDNKAFDYLRKLKTDNTSFFHAGPTPRELTDTELYEGVLENWRP
ncbi:VWA domain-containing protein, partial [Streptomyces sp. NPDC007905]|uniref:VWA domain-containing protein n=1 Tax=Streptomyces sp. NPDC007905 TaxID=3364788 RepID=UPI0036E58D18